LAERILDPRLRAQPAQEREGKKMERRFAAEEKFFRVKHLRRASRRVGVERIDAFPAAGGESPVNELAAFAVWKHGAPAQKIGQVAGEPVDLGADRDGERQLG